MSKTKEQRAKNKVRRKQRRELRNDKFAELVEKVNETPALPENENTLQFIDGYIKYWPIVSKALEIIRDMKLSGAKLDSQINLVIDLGNDVANLPETQSEFRNQLRQIWKYIRIVLIGITALNKNDKHDEQIDKIVEIGDWFSGYES